MEGSVNSAPSREEIGLAVSKYLKNGGRIQHLGCEKPRNASCLLEEYDWYRQGKGELEEDRLNYLAGNSLRLEDI